jgi:hypothetical protein
LSEPHRLMFDAKHMREFCLFIISTASKICALKKLMEMPNHIAIFLIPSFTFDVFRGRPVRLYAVMRCKHKFISLISCSCNMKPKTAYLSEEPAEREESTMENKEAKSSWLLNSIDLVPKGNSKP